MSALTIAILRHPDKLVALTSSYNTVIAAPRYGDTLAIDPYVERIVPIEDVADLYFGRDFVREIHSRWQRLSKVGVLDSAVAADIWDVLSTTIPDEVHPSVDPWRPPVLPKPPRATAAHPRAFRGTKAQPPLPPQTPVVDLRPHLCNLRDVRAILEYIKLLPIDSPSSTPELDSSHIQEIFAVPRSMRLCLWMISLSTKEVQSEFAGVIGHYWALQLDENEPLRRAVARLLRETWLKTPLVWLEALRQIAPHRRAAALVSMLECSHSTSSQPRDFARWLSRLSELSDDESFFNRSWALAQAIHQGASIDALLAGLQMANRYQPDHDFINKQFDDCDATAGITEWIEYARTTTDATWNRESTAMRVWEDCGHLSGLSKLIDKRNWAGMSPDDAFELFNVFWNCRYAESPESMEAMLAVLLRLANRYFHAIRLLPEAYRAKGIRLVRVVADRWEGKDLEQALLRTLDLMPIVCREPFDKSCDSRLYSSMLRLNQNDFDVWRSGNLDSLLALDRASRNQNEASLIARGLYRLASDYPSWLVEGFANSPGSMLRCAHTFGCLSRTQHFAAMDWAINHPVSQCNETDLRSLASVIVASNRIRVLLARPGSRGQLRAFERMVLRC